MESRAAYRELLSVEAFRNLWLGQAISQLGDSLYYLTFVFMVDRLTGDPLLVSANGVVQTLPFLLFALYAGVVADQQDRRRIMLGADLLSVGVLVGLAVFLLVQPKPPIWLLFAAGFLLSLINVFFAPAKNASIPKLAPPHLLLSANALSAATQNFMPLIGLAFSGSVLGGLYALSPRWFFLSAVLLNAASFAASAFFVRRLPAILPEREESHAARGDAWKEMREGLRYVRREHVLLVLLVLSVLVQLVVAPFMVVYVTVNRQWFGGDFRTLALLELAFLVGMVLSSAVIGRLRIQRPGMAFIVGIAVVGATVAAMAGTRSAVWFAFWNFVAGIVLPFAQIPINTYLQVVVPDAFRGRVNSLLAMATFGAQPISIGFAGLLMEQIGSEAMFLIMGGGMGLAGLLGLADRSFRTAVLPQTGMVGTSDRGTGSAALDGAG